jgi:tetratricopeptide (TPR) repeat protein
LKDQRQEPDLNPPGRHFSPAALDQEQNHSSNPLLWALIGFVVALTLVVVLVLPSLVTDPVDESTTSSLAGQARQPAPLAPGVSRHDAELALQKFLRLQGKPGLAGAEIWANAGWQSAVDTATAGDDLYGKGQFKGALASYKNASLQLQALLDERPQYLADSLVLGTASLAENKIDQAVSAFERVLAMQQDHAAAANGLARAQVRNDVLSLMTVGRQAEAGNILQEAATAYSSALSLDADYLPARQASQQLSAEIDKLEFQKAMSLALKYLDMARLKAAKNALFRADKIYPGHPAVVDARSRLAKAERGSYLNAMRRQASLATSKEDWNAAIEIYRKALAFDGQAAFAVSGLDFSRQRAQLHVQLRHYLADTDRLYSEEPLSNARQLLAANKQADAREPVLAGMLIKLQEAVRLALIPVELILRSDQKTRVTIYHVGRLGLFEEKVMSLRPGDYTVTGSRAGFRDVRKVLMLRPGIVIPPQWIRCEEPV